MIDRFVLTFKKNTSYVYIDVTYPLVGHILYISSVIRLYILSVVLLTTAVETCG